MSATEPTNDADRALVVAYWLQEHKGEKQLGGQMVNRELKNLGHGVGRINDVFSELIGTSPQLVIQTRKKGTSQQAREHLIPAFVTLYCVEAMLESDGE